MRKQTNKAEEYKIYKREKKEFSRLRKSALIELIYELQYQNDVLTVKNKKLEEKVGKRDKKIRSYGNAIRELVGEDNNE